MSKNRQIEDSKRKLEATFWEQVNERISHAHYVPTRERRQEEEEHVNTQASSKTENDEC